MSGIKTIAAICCMMSAFHVPMCHGSDAKPGGAVKGGEKVITSFNSPLYSYKLDKDSRQYRATPRIVLSEDAHLEVYDKDWVALFLYNSKIQNVISSTLNVKKSNITLMNPQGKSVEELSTLALGSPEALRMLLNDLTDWNPEDGATFDLLWFKEYDIYPFSDSTAWVEDINRDRLVILSDKQEVHIRIDQNLEAKLKKTETEIEKLGTEIEKLGTELKETETELEKLKKVKAEQVRVGSKNDALLEHKKRLTKLKENRKQKLTELKEKLTATIQNFKKVKCYLVTEPVLSGLVQSYLTWKGSSKGDTERKEFENGLNSARTKAIKDSGLMFEPSRSLGKIS